MKVPTTKWTLLAFFSLAVMIQLTDTSIRSGDDVKPKFDDDSGGFNFLFGKLDVKNQADDLVEHREKRAKTPKTPEAKDVEIKFGGQTIKIGESLEKNTKSCKDKTTFADLIKCVKGPVKTIQKEVFDAMTTECAKQTLKTEIKCLENALAKYKKTATDVIFALFKSMCSNTDKNKKDKCEKDLKSSAKGMLANAIHPELKKLLETPATTSAPTGKAQTQAAPKVTLKAAPASTIKTTVKSPTKSAPKPSSSTPKPPKKTVPTPDPPKVEPKGFTSVHLIELCKNHTKQDQSDTCVEKEKSRLVGIWKTDCGQPGTPKDCIRKVGPNAGTAEDAAKEAFKAKVCAINGESCKEEGKGALEWITQELKEICDKNNGKNCQQVAEKEARKALDSLFDTIPTPPNCVKNPGDYRCPSIQGFSSVDLIDKCKDQPDFLACIGKKRTEVRNPWETNCKNTAKAKVCKTEAERMDNAAKKGATAAYETKVCVITNKICSTKDKVVGVITQELKDNCKKEAKCLSDAKKNAQKAIDSLVKTIPDVPDCTKPPFDYRCPSNLGFSSVELIEFCKEEKDKKSYDKCVGEKKTVLHKDWLGKCKKTKSSTDKICEGEAERRGKAAEKEAKAAYTVKEACAVKKGCNKKMDDAIKAITAQLEVNCIGDQTCIRGAKGKAQGAVKALVDTIPPDCSKLPLDPRCPTPTPATSPEPVTKPVVPSSTPASVSNTSPIEDDEDSYDGMTCMTHRKELNEMHCGLCDELFKAGPRSETDFWEVVTIGLWITFAILSTAAIVFAIYDWRCRRRYAKELKRLRAENAERKLKAAYAKAAAAKKDLPKEEPSPAIPSPPADRNSAHRRMRAKLLETQANLRKLRDHVKKTTAQHKSDARSKKFKKMGPIYIPMEPEITPSAPIPDNIKLENVEYDPTGNEMYDIGSDVDDIELDKSLTVDEDDSEEESKKSKKKTSKKSNKKTSKDGKTGSKTGSKTETDKKDDKKGSKETPESKESGGTPKQATPSGSGSEPKTPESKSKSKEKP